MPEAASLGRQIRTLDLLCRWSQRIFFGSKNPSIGPEVGSGTEKNQKAPPVLRSIDGIGKWGAAVLYIEIGDITRFDSVEKLVACAGPDPQVEQSGDQVSEKRISKRGNRYIRSVLYGCVTAAIRGGKGPPAGRLFDRLKAKGKHRKALRSPVCFGLVAIVCGCWSNGERFAPLRGAAESPSRTRKAG
ncbi:IS110 family transposase [Salinibacter ruber]|uniref:IS110 family transposase n=1 Tax=Salinibacter ruber TaxID=146919 RepID=UPI00216897F3|nr:IS110 family transposase [Salinibacter ruber]MCS4098047.1 hypothetical protein [Salinibacter ruber]